MKNLIISILATKIITDMSFWEYTDADDKIFIFIAMSIVLFVNLCVIEEWWAGVRRKAWMKKHRAERFGQELSEMKERKKA